MGSFGRKIIILLAGAFMSACAFDGRIDDYDKRINSWSVIYYSIHQKTELSNVDIYLNIENNPCFNSLLKETEKNGYPNNDNRLIQRFSKIFYNEEEMIVLYNGGRPAYDQYSEFWYITKPKHPINEITYDNINRIVSEISMEEFDSIYNQKKDTYKTFDVSVLKDSLILGVNNTQ